MYENTLRSPTLRAGAGRRRTVAAIVAVAVAAVCAPAGTASAARETTRTAGSDCRIGTLPVPDGSFRSEVFAGDPTGRYLIGEAAVATAGGTEVVSLFWVRGKLTHFPTPYAEAELRDVNSSGQVVGSAMGPDGHRRGWVYRDGVFTLLPGLKPTDETLSQAINERGDVVGTATDSSASPPRTHLVVWPAARPEAVRELRVAGENDDLVAIDIDDDGAAIGRTNLAIGSTTYVWPARGKAFALRGPSGSTEVAAVSLRKGWVAGWDNSVASGSLPTRWNVRKGIVRHVSTDVYFVYSGNGRGDVGLGGAIARRHGGIVPVPGLTPTAGSAVKVLSDRDLAAGFSNDGQAKAVVWRGC